MSGWRRPSLCGGNGECIEVQAIDGAFVGFRIPQRPGLNLRYWTVTRAEFAAFIAAAKNGEYDDLTELAKP